VLRRSVPARAVALRKRALFMVIPVATENPVHPSERISMTRRNMFCSKRPAPGTFDPASVATKLQFRGFEVAGR
jgi:hypothetical protein